MADDARSLSGVVRRRVVVSGRVQGVWFRQSCADEARLRGVGGWVRNRTDGAVEAAFEGAPSGVAAMVAWCREGPRLANVRHVEETEERPEGVESFQIVG
jgi:acylphosphatase